MIRFRRTSSTVHVRRRDLFSYPSFRFAISGQFVSQTSDALTSFTLAELLVFQWVVIALVVAVGVRFALGVYRRRNQ